MRRLVKGGFLPWGGDGRYKMDGEHVLIGGNKACQQIVEGKNNRNGQHLFQVRLATTCEAMIGEFEDAEMEVLPILQDDHLFSIKCGTRKTHQALKKN